MNYYRVHMLYFAVTIFTASGILYGARGNTNMRYIDCLYMATSAMTVTGLVTVPVSQMTLGQQVVLFILMVMGNLMLNSLFMVLVRRRFFRTKIDTVFQRSATIRARMHDIEEQNRRQREADAEKVRRFLGLGKDELEKGVDGPLVDRSPALESTNTCGGHQRQRLHVGMVHRTDEPARQVNPTGHATTMVSYERRKDMDGAHQHSQTDTAQCEDGISADQQAEKMPANDSVPRHRPPPLEHLCNTNSGKAAHRVQTVSYADPPTSCTLPVEGLRARRVPTVGTRESLTRDERTGASRAPYAALTRTMTLNKTKGLGGLPSPIDCVFILLDALHLTHHFQVPRTATLASTYADREPTAEQESGVVRSAPYLSFDAQVTGNSHFPHLTRLQRAELGGVEYRAINVLCWLIPLYWLGWTLLAIVVCTPYMASNSALGFRRALGEQPKAPRNAEWYSIFNTVSAITNTGMSLADGSFEGGLSNAYLLMIFVGGLVLVGNTMYPVLLRLSIWVLSKTVSKQSPLYESLRFLLDHPRRCFVYLFPSGSTWILLGTVVVLNVIDWFFLMILDLGKRHQSLSTGTWVFDALFQAVAVRTAGFQTFSILNLAPAEQMLQVFMMYLSAYPVTMAVRTTNVYEEGSLGLYDDEPRDEASGEQGSTNVWGRFLSEQVRRQLAFDLWWIALAVWTVLIAEQGKVENTTKYPNLSVFTVLYEVISAYGTVGLSVGAQYSNTSLSGDFGVVSKLIMIAVMFRGRHRGLPSAIDRAILLPSEVHVLDRTHDARLSVSRTGTADAEAERRDDDGDDT
ncbi:hypothetical protein GLX27_002936 [Malassezia furfur]|uniref:Potassium transport protein n=1 Tax=Malassezia furfur TaxID=55194 RepID=A0ABY8ERX2_MALFU|nr:hypothetical protein GLX27_002936 [Malassezia furfur]